jgi:hypothetical protein
MTSPKKVAASRINGRKSRGPRTGAGKARSRRNAYRHGLAAFSVNHDAAMAEQLKQLVDAICEGDDDPLLRQQAAMIAENQLWLSCIMAEKVALIERLRDPAAYALGHDATMARARALLRKVAIADRQLKAVYQLIEKTKAAGRDPERERIPPELEDAWPLWGSEETTEDADRDDYEALREGIGDLERLLRYERRALSRRKKAIRGFMAIKLGKSLSTPRS